MRSLLLIICCCVPCCIVLIQFTKLYKSISVLKKLNQVFNEINFILGGNSPDVKDLFKIMHDREVYPVFTEKIYVRLKKGEAFSVSWNETVQEICADLLSFDEVKEIMSFSSSFGLGSLEAQKHICDRFSMICDKKVNEKNSRIAKNGKMCLSGSLLLGALLFVILC